MQNNNQPLAEITFHSKHLIEALFFCRDRVEDYFDNSSKDHQALTVAGVAKLFGIPAAIHAFLNGKECHPKAGVVICRAVDFLSRQLTEFNPEITKAAASDETRLRSLMMSGSLASQTVAIHAMLLMTVEAHAAGQWRRSLRYLVMAYADAQVLETFGHVSLYKKEGAIREIFNATGAAP